MTIRPAILVLLIVAAPCVRAADAIDFNRDIRPILNNRCMKCHGGVKKAAGLSLIFRSEALKAGESGKPAIVPGQPAASEVVRRIKATNPDDRMPKKAEPLSAADIAKIEKWIAAGAEWEDHWSYVAPKRQAAPKTKYPTRTAVDAFLFARLEREGLAPSPEADRATLLRRASLDLTGLPPTPEELRAFLSNTAPDAYETEVDRLLASPRFGERWAAWWMDLARYADSKGYEKDGARNMWPYRDWLIDAFNRDLPFDQFTIEQLAGDLLPDPTEEQLVATAFHRNTMNNDEGGTDDEEFRIAAVIDRVNTTMEIWNGETWGCIQCHGHPYDPFVHRDYFEVFAFFNQTEDSDKPDDRPTQPVMDWTSRKRARELQAEQARLRKEQESMAQDSAVAGALAAWIQSAEVVQRWVRPDALRVEATGGAVYRADPAGAYVASGENPPTNSIIATFTAGQTPVQAIRLDLIPDAAMKAGGVGRSIDGNIVLSRIRAFAGGQDASPQGRFVRLSLPGASRILNFAELEVMSGGSNVARAGKATASSVDYGGNPERGIDGNTEPIYEKAVTVHTAIQADPWWEVDLLREVPVQEIRLVNRKTLERRLDGAKVEILDAARRTIWSTVIGQADQVYYTWQPAAPAYAIETAWASIEQPEFGIQHALNPTRLSERGWAVGPARDQPQYAVFVLAEPLPPGQTLRVQMDWLYAKSYAPNRFRLSVSDESGLRQLAAIDAEGRQALLKPAALRTASDQKAIRTSFLSRWDRARELQKRLDAVTAELAGVRKVTLPVMRELAPAQQRETHIFTGGNFRNPGEKVQARTPTTLASFPAGAPTNRLGFARWLVATNNTLTARVTVNRFWEQLFGIGIVETLEDFGSQGEKPYHPELLDDLAVRFQEDMKWSMKALLRELTISAAYRQQSKVTPALLEKDPRNRLLARAPRFRLTAEQLRDQALAVSGLLSSKMYGESVMPYQPPGIWLSPYDNRDWATSPGEDAHRRALYTYWRRSSPYPASLNFDGASRDICVSRRIRTNTPLQALNLLNDRAFLECAAALGQVMLQRGSEKPESAIAEAVFRLLGRDPRPEEQRSLLALQQKARADFEKDPAAAQQFGKSADHAAWTLVANALLNLDEVLVKQ